MSLSYKNEHSSRTVISEVIRSVCKHAIDNKTAWKEMICRGTSLYTKGLLRFLLEGYRPILGSGWRGTMKRLNHEHLIYQRAARTERTIQYPPEYTCDSILTLMHEKRTCSFIFDKPTNEETALIRRIVETELRRKEYLICRRNTANSQ